MKWLNFYLNSFSSCFYLSNTFSPEVKRTEALTLAVLTVLVARSDRVYAVAGGAVRRVAVGLGGGQAVSGLDRLRALAAAGWDGVGGLQAAVQGGDGELMLGLRGHSARVAEDAHHLVGRKESGSAKRYGNHFIIKEINRFSDSLLVTACHMKFNTSSFIGVKHLHNNPFPASQGSIY